MNTLVLFYCFVTSLSKVEKEAMIQLNMFMFDCIPIMQSPQKQLFSFVYGTIKLANMIGKFVKLAS